MKKWSLLFALLVVSGSVGFSQVTSGEWTYELNDSSQATITAYNGAGGEVLIPGTLDGYSVTRLGSSNFMSVFGWNNTSVTSVTIPESVTSIGGYAFVGCAGLTSVIIPNSVTNVGQGAFQGCTNLTTVTIGAGLQLAAGGLMNIFGWDVKLTHVVFADGTTQIADGALSGQTSLVSVIIPSTVTRIGGIAFSGCTSLTSVTIPAGVTSIGESAFGGCSSLASVTLPDSLTSIGAYAFGGCSSLINLTIPENVTSIGRDAFFGCASLTSVSLPNSLTSIQPSTFANCTGLANVTIPNSVTNIGTYAFSGCTSLTSVSLPDSLTSIEYEAFSDCSSLANVSLPQGITNIGYRAFEDTALTDITVPESVIWLGIEAFLRAPITNAVIPAKLIAQYGAIGLPPDVSSSLLLSALTNDFGIATGADVTAAESRGVASVTNSPSSFGLYDSTQYEANRITGVAEGKAEVTNNPTAYSLFTESSIMDMNMGGLMLKKAANANELDLELTIETKDNLATNGWRVAERIARKVSMSGVQRQFLRVRADTPYVAPNVKVLAHPTLGSILTDGSGRVLYFFAADSPGGNPLFSGGSWPYVTCPEAPKADTGVSATLASSTFGRPGGPYLTVNGRPAYYYVGDGAAGQANGHGLGSVWWTVRADGVINQ
jgi:predicted lipoprotein with Yx(FWY)xxD motif